MDHKLNTCSGTSIQEPHAKSFPFHPLASLVILQFININYKSLLERFLTPPQCITSPLDQTSTVLDDIFKYSNFILKLSTWNAFHFLRSYEQDTQNCPHISRTISCKIIFLSPVASPTPSCKFRNLYVSINYHKWRNSMKCLPVDA